VVGRGLSTFVGHCDRTLPFAVLLHDLRGMYYSIYLTQLLAMQFFTPNFVPILEKVFSFLVKKHCMNVRWIAVGIRRLIVMSPPDQVLMH
jgi:hypothetical protein